MRGRVKTMIKSW